MTKPETMAEAARRIARMPGSFEDKKRAASAWWDLHHAEVGDVYAFYRAINDEQRRAGP